MWSSPVSSKNMDSSRAWVVQDTVGWVSKRASGLYNPVPFTLKGLVPKKVEKEKWRRESDHPENACRNGGGGW